MTTLEKALQKNATATGTSFVVDGMTFYRIPLYEPVMIINRSGIVDRRYLSEAETIEYAKEYRAALKKSGYTWQDVDKNPSRGPSINLSILALQQKYSKAIFTTYGDNFHPILSSVKNGIFYTYPGYDEDEESSVFILPYKYPEKHVDHALFAFEYYLTPEEQKLVKKLFYRLHGSENLQPKRKEGFFFESSRWTPNSGYIIF